MQRPKFFIDENLPHEYATSLRRPFAVALFRSHLEEKLSSTDDVVIFPELKERDFTVFVTQDKRQLSYPQEREGLRAAGLHWIGVMGIDAKGIDFHAAALASLLAVLPGIIRNPPSTPHAFFVGPEHRMRVSGPRIEEI